MQQITNEVLLDLQIAAVDIRHPGQGIHFLDDLTLWSVNDLAVLVPE